MAHLKAKMSVTMGRLDSWVVSHSALNIGTLRHALGRALEPWWWQTLFWPKHNIYDFFMILFGLFDLILLYLSVKFVMWIMKQKIEKKRNLFFKKMSMTRGELTKGFNF